MKIALKLILFLLFAGPKVGSESCDQDETILTCRCASNEEIDVYYVTTDTIASLNIFSCTSANLTIIMGPRIETTTMSIKVENVTDVLLVCPSLPSSISTSDEFLNVENLAGFKSECTFKLFASSNYFQIENTVIGTFDQDFYSPSVVQFVLKNVTISDLRGLKFSTLLHGSELQIIDSYINVTMNISLFLTNFDNILIANSTFGFPRGGNIVIYGTRVHLTNNTFLNASVHLIGKHAICLIYTFADGYASVKWLRVTWLLNHNLIVSHGNRLPSRISRVYPRRNVTSITFSNMPGAIVNLINRMFGTITKTVNHGNAIHQGCILYFVMIASVIAARIRSIYV